MRKTKKTAAPIFNDLLLNRHLLGRHPHGSRMIKKKQAALYAVHSQSTKPKMAARQRLTNISKPPILPTFRYYNCTLLSRSELLITETELKLIAAAAMIGDNRIPKNGYSTPAAIGTPAVL